MQDSVQTMSEYLKKQRTYISWGVKIWGILTAGPGVPAHVLAGIFLTDMSLTDDSKPVAGRGMLSAADTDSQPPTQRGKQKQYLPKEGR